MCVCGESVGGGGGAAGVQLAPGLKGQSRAPSQKGYSYQTSRIAHLSSVESLLE